MKKIMLLGVAVAVVTVAYAKPQQEMGKGDTISSAQDSLLWSLMLQEVKVAAPSKTRMKGEAFVTRVVGTSLANVGRATDVLAKVPGMMVHQGEVQVIGKGVPTYYIDGRKVLDVSELQQISSYEIKDVEVITTPGAKYDAQTSSVVLIRTLRRRDDGIGVTVESKEEKALLCPNNRWNTFFNISYHNRAFDLFGGLSYNNDFMGRYVTNVTQETFGANNSYFQNCSTNLSMQYKTINANIGASWLLDDNNSIGIRVEHCDNIRGGTDFVMDDEIRKDNRFMDYLVTNTHTDNDDVYSWLANVYYMGQIESWNMEWNTDYYYTRSRSNAQTAEQSLVENREVMTNENTKSSLIASKLVISHPLRNGSVSFGSEFAFVARSNDYDITDGSINNADNYVKENTYVAFAEYRGKINALGEVSLGARYEYVNYHYEDKLLPESSLRRNTNSVFPFVSLSVQIGGIQSSLSYSVKTARPYYRTLRSNIEYNNRFTLTTGNPTLKNEVRHEVGLNARWKSLSFSLNYLCKKDGIYDWTYPYDDDGRVLISWVNFPKPIHLMGAFFNISPFIGIWQPNYTIGIQKQWLSFQLDDPRTTTGKRMVDYGRPLLIVNTNNAFRLPTHNGCGIGAWQLELNSELMSSGHYGNAEIKNWSWNLSCAVQKSFLNNDALTIRLAVSDIFHKAYNNVRLDLGNYVMTQSNILGQQRECYDMQRITLTVRYQWNAGKNKYKGKGAGKDVMERL